MSSEPKAIVGGRILKSFPQDACPLVNQSNTILGTATRDFVDRIKVTDYVTGR